RDIEALDLRVGGFDDVIFVGRMCAAAVAESEMARGQLERFAGEDISRIRAGIARPEQRVDSEFFVGCRTAPGSMPNPSTWPSDRTRRSCSLRCRRSRASPDAS